MTALTPEDHEALAAVALADWMATPVIPVVEAIVARHVTAALTEVVRAIETATVPYYANATDGLAMAARIVRDLAAPPA